MTRPMNMIQVEALEALKKARPTGQPSVALEVKSNPL